MGERLRAAKAADPGVKHAQLKLEATVQLHVAVQDARARTVRFGHRRELALGRIRKMEGNVGIAASRIGRLVAVAVDKPPSRAGADGLPIVEHAGLEVVHNEHPVALPHRTVGLLRLVFARRNEHDQRDQHDQRSRNNRREPKSPQPAARRRRGAGSIGGHLAHHSPPYRPARRSSPIPFKPISELRPLRQATRRPFSAFIVDARIHAGPSWKEVDGVQDAPPMLLAHPHARQKSKGYGFTPRRAIASGKRGGLGLAGAARERRHPCHDELGAAARCASPRPVAPVRTGAHRCVRALIGRNSTRRYRDEAWMRHSAIGLRMGVFGAL